MRTNRQKSKIKKPLDILGAIERNTLYMHFIQYVDNLAKISDDLNAISIIISELDLTVVVGKEDSADIRNFLSGEILRRADTINNISNDIYIGGKEYKKKYQEAMQKWHKIEKKYKYFMYKIVIDITNFFIE